MEFRKLGNVENCKIKLRDNPLRRKKRVLVGCGAGFGGDRSLAALKLLQRVDQLDYIVLECLAERTLADRYQTMMSGGDGFDPRITEWMSLLLPISVEKGVCIITNMGGVDPSGAQKAIMKVAKDMSLDITVSAVEEAVYPQTEMRLSDKQEMINCGASTYLGAAPVVECLEKYKPHVVVASRIADASLFLAPMVFELGWNWNDYELLAKGALAGHLLECGCQLTGGYFMHSGDEHRNLPIPKLLDLSLPFAEVQCDGQVYLGKAVGSGGVLNRSTCAQQLLYEVGDPSAYITPDVIIDIRDVNFQPITPDEILCLGAKPAAVPVPDTLLQLIPEDCGWKGWGEISYGGFGCLHRAEVASIMVRSWMEEAFPGVRDGIISYMIGLDSLKIARSDKDEISEVRLRMDGLFESEEQAAHFAREFTALYTNGPAGGGGISVGHKKEITLRKELVSRESVFWRTSGLGGNPSRNRNAEPDRAGTSRVEAVDRGGAVPAPSGERMPLHRAAHCRSGDKGNDLNVSVVPHCPGDLSRLKAVITPRWARRALSAFLEESTRVEVYEVRGASALNVIATDVLDGGVNRSRRIDRHGKTVSDVVLAQEIVLPP
ncbi:propionyl-CoA carboxylase isoform X2 [Wolffia australiana]